MDRIILAGGGDFGQQQQIAVPEVHVEVVQPPADHTLLIVSGIVVPVVIAIIIIGRLRC